MVTAIGFAGLGSMGLPMATNLHKALSSQTDSKFEPQLLVWNRTASKAEPLVADGAQQVEDLAGKAYACY